MTSLSGSDPEVILIPRSLFFNTRLYAYLNASNPTSPLDNLVFRQNSTTASSNSDELQQILTGNVTLNDFLALVDMLTVNASGGKVGRTIGFSINDEVAGNPLFYSLPDGVVRLVGYLPPKLVSFSSTYTFCTSSCGPPTAKPWWENVWTGRGGVDHRQQPRRREPGRLPGGPGRLPGGPAELRASWSSGRSSSTWRKQSRDHTSARTGSTSSRQNP